MRETLREFLYATTGGINPETVSDPDNAVLFLGDAIREAAPGMEWNEAQRIATFIVTTDD